MKPFQKSPTVLLAVLAIPLAGSLTSCSLFSDGALNRSHRSGNAGAATTTGRRYETIYTADRGLQHNGSHGTVNPFLNTHPRVDAAKWFAESLRQEAYRLGSDRKTKLSFEGATGVAYLNGVGGTDCSGTGNSSGRRQLS